MLYMPRQRPALRARGGHCRGSVTMATRRSRGFTLIEIMLVVIILAILAMVIIPRLSDASDD